MKFELSLFIVKAFFYITFPIIMIVGGLLAIMKLNPITVLIGVFQIVFGLIEPFLAYDLLIKYTDQVLQEKRVNKRVGENE